MRQIPVILFLLCLLYSSHARTLMHCDRSKGNTFDDACDPKKYALDMLVVFVPGIVIAVIILLSCPMFLCGRLCCNCCGGRRPSAGCCCPDRGSHRYYTKRSVIITKLLTVLVLVVVILGLIIGLVGSKKVNKGVNGLFDAAKKAIDNVARKPLQEVQTACTSINADLETAAEEYAALGGTASTFTDVRIPTKDMAQIQNSLNDVDGDIDDIQDVVDKFDKYRSLATIIALIVCVVFVGLGVIFGVTLNLRKFLPYLILTFLFICATIMWILFAVHVTAASVAKDVCDEVHHSVHEPDQSTLRMVVFKDGCPIQIDEVKNKIDKIKQQLLDKSCVITNEYICSQYNMAFNCDSSPPKCDTMEDLFNIPNQIMVKQESANALHKTNDYPFCLPFKDHDLDCTIAKCAQTCAKSEVKAPSVLVMVVVSIARQVNHILFDVIYPLLDCDELFNRIVGPFQDPCNELRDGLATAATGICILACGLIFAIILFILGIKRFIALSDAVSSRHEELTITPDEIKTIM